MASAYRGVTVSVRVQHSSSIGSFVLFNSGSNYCDVTVLFNIHGSTYVCHVFLKIGVYDGDVAMDNEDSPTSPSMKNIIPWYRGVDVDPNGVRNERTVDNFCDRLIQFNADLFDACPSNLVFWIKA